MCEGRQSGKSAKDIMDAHCGVDRVWIPASYGFSVEGRGINLNRASIGA